MAPGLRNRFIGLCPEYLELVWVEDEDAFAAGDEPVRAFRRDRRPFGLGILAEDTAALHELWTSRGIVLPPVAYESPAGSGPDEPPLFAFQPIPAEALPGVDAFALTSFYAPTPPTRREVWVAPNSTFALEGMTLVSITAEADARRWQEFLTPDESVRLDGPGYVLDVGPHRLTWLAPADYEDRYGWAWTPGSGGAGALAALELLALDVDEVAARARRVGRPARRLPDGGLALEPSAYDGFHFVVRAGDLLDWVRRRDDCLGVEHTVRRMDDFMDQGTPGDGEYVVRTATPADLRGIRELAEEVLPATYGSITPEGYVARLIEDYWSDAANTHAIGSTTDTLIVAESAFSGVVGVAHTARYDETSIILWRLYVRPQLHGRGIGSALLAECTRRCPSYVDRMVTEYFADNGPAARFYAARGFSGPRPETLAWRGTSLQIVYVDRPVPRRSGENPAQDG